MCVCAYGGCGPKFLHSMERSGVDGGFEGSLLHKNRAPLRLRVPCTLYLEVR